MELDDIKSYGVSKNHERICDPWHYAHKYCVTAFSICNLRLIRSKGILYAYNNKIRNTIKCKIRFLNSVRYMASFL